MEITRTAKRKLAEVKIWQCRGCDVVHMSVAGMVLNFSRDDFAAFTEDVVSINYSDWTSNGKSILDLIEHDADRYADAVFH